jgi:hypothetical protein
MKRATLNVSSAELSRIAFANSASIEVDEAEGVQRLTLGRVVFVAPLLPLGALR